MRKAELALCFVLAAQRGSSLRLTRELQRIKLTPSHCEVLLILGDHGPLSPSGLGEVLVCESGRNPRRLVDRRVGVGLVQQVISPQDRRQVVLRLTSAAHHTETAVRAVQERLNVGVEAAVAGVDRGPVLQALSQLSTTEPAGMTLEHRINAQQWVPSGPRSVAISVRLPVSPLRAH